MGNTYGTAAVVVMEVVIVVVVIVAIVLPEVFVNMCHAFHRLKANGERERCSF